MIFKDKLICKVCSTPRGRDRQYNHVCSLKCKRIYDNKLKINHRAFIKCANCDTEFQPSSSTNIYCSKQCLAVYVKDRVKVYTSEFSIFERDDFKCIYCGKSSIEHGVELQVDHIEPIFIGGISCRNNLITSCKACNISKNAKILSDEVKLRLLNIVVSRNSALGIKQISDIEKQIESIKKRDNYRMRNIK